ncbi:meprin A subunit alpha-like [Salminus brasiliensis]|uniref:meprin A subunit alpha-like n=1 Tax=Salminus brasiliensis TaxID=930266 RepID=UPI003B836524
MQLLGLLCCVALFSFSSSFTIGRFSRETSHAIDGEKVLRWDIPFINKDVKTPLVGGDMALPPGRNALIDKAYRWQFPIPYIFDDSLDLNAKGVIFQAFETYRLKSCVDFKPYEGEKSFIRFEKLDGCWSMVGDLKEGQRLSLGENCDYKGTIMHEILHALGFYHEQSRTDRDEYINIWWNQIIPGMEHNFNKYDDSFITDQNTPYDYESIMHYGPYSFNADPRYPTMTAKDPELTKVLGQYNDFSSLDLLRLNRMYNCSAPLTLLDQCFFETLGICGMIKRHQKNGVQWVRSQTSPQSSDHTLVGQCRDAGHYMFLSTNSGKAGDSAFLESRTLYPKRKLQCLQIFYKMTGSPKDKLVIWTKQVASDGTPTGTAIATLNSDDDHSWKIAHVPLRMDGKSHYAFQGISGDPSHSSGGILLDDITLAETRCPSATWRIANFSSYLANYAVGEYIQSPRFYSPEGYGFGLQLLPNSYVNGYIGAFFHLTSGENDKTLHWPAGNRQVTMTVLDQDPDVTQRQSFSYSFTTNGKQLIPGTDRLYWDEPSKVGTYDPSCDCYRGWTWGYNAFFTHFDLRRRSYLKNDDLILFIEFEDLTPLINQKTSNNI